MLLLLAPQDKYAPKYESKYDDKYAKYEVRLADSGGRVRAVWGIGRGARAGRGGVRAVRLRRSGGRGGAGAVRQSG